MYVCLCARGKRKLWVVGCGLCIFGSIFTLASFFWVLRNFASSLKSFVKGLFEKGLF